MPALRGWSFGPLAPAVRRAHGAGMRRFGLISDTHGHLHPRVLEIFEGVEAIWHAGDVVDEGILDELEVVAPTLAVQGNCDFPVPRLPALREILAPFGKVIVTHSHMIGGGAGPPSRLVDHFARLKPRLILYGHTHKRHESLHGGIWLVNPGAACRPRFRDESSVAVAQWDEKADELSFRFVPLEWKKG